MMDPRLVQQWEATDVYVGELRAQVRTLQEQLRAAETERDALRALRNEFLDGMVAFVKSLSDDGVNAISTAISSAEYDDDDVSVSETAK